jgi:hypothetical protein
LPPDYGVRASIQVEKLDDIVDPDMITVLQIGVVKIDVENYEKFILLGGQNFFNTTSINLLFIEFIMGLSGDTMSRNKFVYEFLNNSGFAIGREVEGPPVMFNETESSIVNGPMELVVWRKTKTP